MVHNGSIQKIDQIPQDLKDLYKTVWELSQKAIIDMAADRGAYICQSQSLNLFLENANLNKLSSMHFYAWKKGLKTGMYYLRTKSAVDPIKFTLSDKHQRKFVDQTENQANNDVEMINPSKTTEQRKVALQEMLEASTESDTIIEGQVCTMEDGCISCQG